MSASSPSEIKFAPMRIGVALLSLCAAFQVGMGGYFIALRPTLLPEDERAIGASLAEIARVAPDVAAWLNRVFVVLGGHAVATGLLTFSAVYLVSRVGRLSTAPLLLIAGVGLFSVVLMSAINFLIRSDFRWVLLVPAAVWVAGIVVFAFQASPSDRLGGTILQRQPK